MIVSQAWLDSSPSKKFIEERVIKTIFDDVSTKRTIGIIKVTSNFSLNLKLNLLYSVLHGDSSPTLVPSSPSRKRFGDSRTPRKLPPTVASEGDSNLSSNFNTNLPVAYAD